MKRQFIVTLEMPRGVTVAEMEEYVEEAVAVWKGQEDPDSPIFDLDGMKVKARAVRQARKTVKAAKQ